MSVVASELPGATTPAATNPCQERLDRLDWVMGDVYRAHGVVVEVRTTSSALGDWIGRTLGANRASGEPEARFSVAVGDEGPGSTSIHTLYRGITPIVRSRRASTLARTLLAELEAFSYPTRDDAVFVYGTIVAFDDRTALIPSYLAPYLSRSRRLIETSGIRMSAGPAVAVDARSGRLRATRTLLEVPPRALGRLTSSEGAPPEPLAVADHPHVDAVCWFSRGQELPVAEISRARALYVLAGDTANLGRLGGDALVSLARLLRDARCFEVRGDTPRAMLASLVDAVRGEPERASA
jgi:hypothetical protein